MWQAISTLLRDCVKTLVIELKTERQVESIPLAFAFGGRRMLREKYDERGFAIFTNSRSAGAAVAKQNRSRTAGLAPSAAIATVTSWCPGTSSPVLDGQQLAHLHQWAISRSSVWILITIFHHAAAQHLAASLVGFFCRAAYRLAAGARGGEGIALWRYRYLSRYGTAAMANHQPQLRCCTRIVVDPAGMLPPATGATASAI